MQVLEQALLEKFLGLVNLPLVLWLGLMVNLLQA
jgi:hypothetical protein